MIDTVIQLRENADLDAAEHVPHEVVRMQYAAADEIERLRAEVAHLSIYKPARRTEQKQKPVKAIGPCNFSFYGIDETDSEFYERAGTQIQEVTE